MSADQPTDETPPPRPVTAAALVSLKVLLSLRIDWCLPAPSSHAASPSVRSSTFTDPPQTDGLRPALRGVYLAHQ